MTTTKITKLTCLRCGHSWWPKTPDRPMLCAKCRSAYWERPKKNKKEETK